MPEPKGGVKEEVSPASDNQDNPSDDGNSSVSGPDAERWANLQKENKRKAQEIKELRSQNEKMAEQYSSVESRLNELQQKVSPTPKEEDEIASHEEWLSQVQRDPNFKNWSKLINREGVTNADKKVFEYDYNKAVKQIGKIAKSEGMKKEEFEGEILEILKTRRIEGMPTDRLEEAYDIWKADKTARDTATKDAESRLNGNPALGNSRSAKPVTYSDQLKTAQETGDFTAVLDGIAKAQSEAKNRK